MRRADRLFRLVQLLRTSRVRTGASLAEELGVSVRTVYRDIRDLEHRGVPIEGEAGVGYRLARGHDLPPMTFTAAEIEALVLGARMVRAWADDELGEAAEAALDKIREVLPTPLRPLADDTTLFAPYGLPRQRVPPELGPVRRAIRERRKLWLRYQSADGPPSERVIWPLGLFFWGARWSLSAWCELRQAARHFRIDRIELLDPLDESFPHHPERTLQAVLDAEAALAASRGMPMLRGTSDRRP